MSSLTLTPKNSLSPLPRTDGVEFGKTSLIFHRDITEEEWKTLGHELKNMYKASLWWIGDWLAYGHRMFEVTEEERKLAVRQLSRLQAGVLDSAANELGMSKGHLANVKSVAMRVIPSCRHEQVTLAHATEILRVIPSDKQYPFWADQVVKENLSVRVLRGKLRESQSTEKESPLSQRPSLFLQDYTEMIRRFQVESKKWTPAEIAVYEKASEVIFAFFGR